MKTLLIASFCLLLVTFSTGVSAQSRQKEQLRQALKDTEVKGPWVYDDIATGFAKARLEKKPIMLVFR